MSTRTPSSDAEPELSSPAELADFLAAGSKPVSAWRIGTEHEKFVYHAADQRPVSYEEPSGIRALLQGLAAQGWTPIEENGHIIALNNGANASVSLEPGGQFELSGAPVETLHETCRETGAHLDQCAKVCTALGLEMLGHGFLPLHRREEVPMMPKPRYAIMKRHMPRVGTLGLDMMLRTCTIQVNLDFASEADMVRKFRVGMALQPLATALFANSPFTEGKPNGFLSYRSHIWTDTDPHRTGLLPFVFDEGFGFERYVEYMLDVPMYFVVREGQYVDLAGESFRAFLNGTLDALPGQRPTLSDWKDHLSTAFPEVRLKQFLEMRGADGGPWRRICGLPAFWVGLLYDESALSAAEDVIRSWSVADIASLRDAVPKQGLRTTIAGRPLLDIARDVLAIADAGLKARNKLDASGQSEQSFLNELHSIVTSGQTPADRLLAAWQGEWHQDVRQIYEAEKF